MDLGFFPMQPFETHGLSLCFLRRKPFGILFCDRTLGDFLALSCRGFCVLSFHSNSSSFTFDRIVFAQAKPLAFETPWILGADWSAFYVTMGSSSFLS